MNYLYPEENDKILAALGFPTEPQDVIETNAEGEAQP
jgi:hypothetical protein